METKKSLPAPKQARSDKPKKIENPTPRYKKQTNTLLIDPKVWAKLIYMRDREGAEVSGFGISESEENSLHIIDFKLVPQVNLSVFTEFEDKGLANYLEDMCMSGVSPARCLRIWIHTHPGMSPQPSGHDESTFKRVNADSTWGVMCIIADSTEFARGVVNDGTLSGTMALTVSIAFDSTFEGVTDDDFKAWEDEYCENVSYGVIPEPAGSCERPLYGHEAMREAWLERSSGPVREFELPDINGEFIHQIDDQCADGFCYVYTDKWWFQFGNRLQIEVDVGDTIVSAAELTKIADPVDYGELCWNGNAPIMIASEITGVSYLDEAEEQALAELDKCEADREEAALAEQEEEDDLAAQEQADEEAEDAEAAEAAEEHPKIIAARNAAKEAESAAARAEAAAAASPGDVNLKRAASSARTEALRAGAVVAEAKMNVSLAQYDQLHERKDLAGSNAGDVATQAQYPEPGHAATGHCGAREAH